MTPLERTSALPPSEDGPTKEPQEPEPRKGVFGWVKGKIQKRNIAANMNNINLDKAKKAAVVADTAQGEPSDLDIAMGLGEGGVVDDDGVIPDDEKIDLEAENDEGLLVGWGKKLQEVEWVQKTVQVVEEQVTNHREQQELEQIHEQYKEEIKQDPEIKALQRKIKKITKNLKVQRLNGDRTNKRNTYSRDKAQDELDKKTVRLKKAIWTFSNSSMNSHEYAKAMMRASARLQRKGIKVHKSEKALAMEAAVLRNMHRMLAIQKQYTMSKRACNDVSSFMKRCKGWLDNKLADGEMGIMVLEATSKSMVIMYEETVQVQEGIKTKMEDPENHEFKKERMKTILSLPMGLRSMPTFLKGPKQPPMQISLRKKMDDVDPNLRGYRTFKEQNKAMEKAWKEELKNYENMLEVGGKDTKIIDSDDVSDLGDSEDEIEANLAAVSIGAAAAKKAHINIDEMVTEQKHHKEVTFQDGEPEDKPTETETDSTKDDMERLPTDEEVKAAKEKAAEDDKFWESKDEEKAAGDDDTAGESLATGGGDINPPDEKKTDEKDQSERSADPVPEETPSEQGKADAAALEEAQKSGDEEDPEVDEEALPEEVKQEDLDTLLDKEADDANIDTFDNGDNTVEEALAGVVEDALAAVGDEEGAGSGSDDEEPVVATPDAKSVVSAESTEVSV